MVSRIFWWRRAWRSENGQYSYFTTCCFSVFTFDFLRRNLHLVVRFVEFNTRDPRTGPGKNFCDFIFILGALSVGEASHATVSPTLHYMMGIAFGHNIYSLLYHFINADWNDRFSQFLTNRQTWQGFARLFVYTSALVCHLCWWRSVTKILILSSRISNLSFSKWPEVTSNDLF